MTIINNIENSQSLFKRIGWDKYETALLVEAFWKIEDKDGNREDILKELSKNLRQKAINQGYLIDDKFRNYNGMAIQLANLSTSFFPERPHMHKTQIFEEIADLYKNHREKYNNLLEEAHKLIKESTKEDKIDIPSNKVDFYKKIELSFTQPTKVVCLNDSKIGFNSWAECYKYIMLSLYGEYPQIFIELAEDSICTVISTNPNLLRRSLKIDNNIFLEGNRSANDFVKHIKVMLDICGVDYDNIKIEYIKKENTSILNRKILKKEIEEENQEILDISDYNSVIQSIFPNGYAFTNPLRKNKFIQQYEKIVGREFVDTDSEYIKKIKQVGFISEGKVYLTSMIPCDLSEEIKSFIDYSLENSPVIYYSSIYQVFSERLNSIFSEDMLKKYIQFEFRDNFLFDNMYVNKKGEQINLKQILVETFLNCGCPLDIEEIYNKLPNISHNAIDSIIRDKDFIVNYRGKSYFYKELFVIDDNQLENIRNFIEKTIQEKETVSGVELYNFIKDKMPTLIDENPNVTDLGFKNIVKLKLANEFNFKGDVISAIGQNQDIRSLYTNFCKRREKFTLFELEEFRDSINQNYIDWNGVIMQSVRVDNKTFIRRDIVNFDVQKIDDAIDKYCVKEYLSFNDIINFTEFPTIGYAWNNYVLESYLFTSSRKFKLIHATFNSDKPVGGIVKINSKINDFDDLLEKVIKDNKLFDSEKAFVFLLENDFIKTRKVKNIDLLIERAKREG